MLCCSYILVSGVYETMHSSVDFGCENNVQTERQTSIDML